VFVKFETIIDRATNASSSSHLTSRYNSTSCAPTVKKIEFLSFAYRIINNNQEHLPMLLE
jgi:hypothetical protein